MPTLEPWWKVVTPRKEIRKGRSFNPDEFAIALEQVVNGTAPEDYRDPREFFEPIYRHRGRNGPHGVVLDPNDFYILATREAVVVPPDHAAEMIPYDAAAGEFRVHYAGFFDPGFGSAEAEGTGSRAVLEVRSHEVPFLIEHGQVVGRMLYEPLIARPDRLYGGAIGSSYQRQGLALSKHFKKVSWA